MSSLAMSVGTKIEKKNMNNKSCFDQPCVRISFIKQERKAFHRGAILLFRLAFYIYLGPRSLKPDFLRSTYFMSSHHQKLSQAWL